MTVRKETRRGKRVLVIDILYKRTDGSPARYRRDSKAATKAAAWEEERRVRERIARTGTPFESRTSDEAEADVVEATFGEVVEKYRALFMPSELKITTRRGYNSVLNHHLLPRFADLPVSSVDGDAASELDVSLADGKSRRGTKRRNKTRDNIQIVLRSVLSFAKRKGLITELPNDLPRLRNDDVPMIEIPDDAQVTTILSAAHPMHQRSFALMSDGGLRPNEVRALRRRGVRLRWEAGEPIGGIVAVREGISFGEAHTPKTGPREIPISRRLAKLLAPTEGLRMGDFVALNAVGRPWSQWGLRQAFARVCRRVGLDGWSVYCLRHRAITWWLRAGVRVHMVQKMAGHKHLKTTQGYVHFLRTDLADAERKLGNMLETPPQGDV